MAKPASFTLSAVHMGPDAPRKYVYVNGKRTDRWTYLSPAEYRVWQAKQKAAAASAATSKKSSAAGSSSSAKTTTQTVPFDYDKYLANEPTLQAALGDIRTSRTTQGAQLIGGEQQIFGRLGEAPDLSQPQYANLPPELRNALASALAPESGLQGIIDQSNQAGTSALARLQQSYRDADSADIGSLGARGVIRSSALAQHLNENLRGLTLGQYDARLGASDALGSLQQNYLTNQQTLTGQETDALNSAQQRAASLISLGQLGPYTTTGATVAAGGTAAGAAPKLPTTNPYLPVTTGSTTSFEPHATAANYGQPAAPTAPTPAAKAAPYKVPSLGFKALR